MTRQGEHTPAPLRVVTDADTSSDDASPSLPGLSLSQRVVRAGAVAGAVATLVATFYGGSHWVASAAVLEAQPDIDSKREAAIKTEREAREAADAKLVPREVYAEHVREAREDRDEAKAERRQILERLDAIGKQAYRSERRWKREIDGEGSAP